MPLLRSEARANSHALAATRMSLSVTSVTFCYSEPEVVLCYVCCMSVTATRMSLESGIVLEAFGNAKTVHNDNSSRFGKWCNVRFDRYGQIAACSLSSFLLEKSRVVTHADGERSYHILYQVAPAAAAAAVAVSVSL